MTPAGRTGSSLTHLEGSLSGRTYPADELVGLDAVDGGPLLARYDLRRAAETLTKHAVARRNRGLWRWHELLPVRDWSHVTSLGEGDCPLLPARRLGEAFGLADLRLKEESLNPTGSFKARGMAVAVSRALELGATHLVVPSAGNAGGALAAYAARSGLRATVVMPVDAPASNRIEVQVTGADLILVEGLISDCGRLASRIAEEQGAFDLSTLKEPYRVEGKKTMGFELVEAFEWSVPDAIVYPTGGGTGLIGMWKAFAELEEVGLMDSERPRLIAVQAEGCAPIVRAFGAGERFAEPWPEAATAAAGIRVPQAVGDFLMLDAIRGSGGTAIAVPEREIHEMQRFVARRTGAYVGLETAAAAAALPAMTESGRISARDRVVLFDTGSGYKSEAPAAFDSPPILRADGEDWDPAIQTLRSRS